MMLKKYKNEKGITLVALIVTVIVLMILTGITLSVTIGNSGIIKKLQEAKENEQLAEEMAQNKINAVKSDNASSKDGVQNIVDNVSSDVTIKVSDTTSNSITVNAIVTDEISGISSIEYSCNRGITYEKDKTNDTATNYTFSNLDENTIYLISVKVTKKITTGSSIDTSTVNTIATTTTQSNPTVPKRYSYIEGNANNGYVIKDINNNEWVWVPVQNAVIDVSYYPTDGTKDDEINAIIGGITNLGLYPMAIKVSGGNYKSILYNFTSSGQTAIPYTSSNTGYAEPKFLTNADGSSTITQSTIQTDFNNMINKVKQYGGFYVGRYEITGTATVPTEKSGIPITGNSWYDSYNTCKNVTNGNTNVITQMIWGCTWDKILGWLATSLNGKTYSQIVDSTSWGNYNVSTVLANDNTTTIKASGTSIILNTGITNFTKANNIYDLAGNIEEWTAEANQEDSRVLRGNNSSATTNTLVSYRGIDAPNNTNSARGSRAILLLN